MRRSRSRVRALPRREVFCVPRAVSTERPTDARARVFSARVVVACAIAIAMASGRAGTPAATLGTLRAHDAKRALAVDRLILGASPLAGIYRGVDASEAAATVRAALDVGFTRFDTAPHYGLGLSETRLGEALRTHAKKAVKVYTKVGRVMKPMDEVTESERESVDTKTTFYEYEYRLITTHGNKRVYNYVGVRDRTLFIVNAQAYEIEEGGESEADEKTRALYREVGRSFDVLK